MHDESMQDGELDELLSAAAREYHEPVATPREAMWQAVERARAPRRRRPARVLAFRRWLPLAAAATLLLAAGVGIGRLSKDDAPGTVVTEPPPAAVESATAYRLATLEHLSQSEEFLTLFRSALDQGDHRLAAATARRLLGTNRLLLDSPAAADRRTRLLLEDLELVLAGIAQLTGDARRQDLELITEGLERGSVMPRLRTVVPSGATSSQGVL